MCIMENQDSGLRVCITRAFQKEGNQTPKVVGETATDSQGSCGVMMLGRARGHKEAKRRMSMRLLSPFPHDGSQGEPREN